MASSAGLLRWGFFGWGFFGWGFFGWGFFGWGFFGWGFFGWGFFGWGFFGWGFFGRRARRFVVVSAGRGQQAGRGEDRCDQDEPAAAAATGLPS